MRHSSFVQLRGNEKLAGGFSDWLRGTETSFRSGKGGADVPCGTCTACCRSSLFIHINPEETETIRRIPRALLFPAPGLPEGNLFMGYDDNGRCPMLFDDKCSIYEHRPQTCRDYDCRLFAATGVPIDRATQPDIARRVQEWVFKYEAEGSREEHAALQEAAAFLQKNKSLFPQGSLPTHPGRLAILAVRVYRLFANMTAKARDDAAIADAIASLLRATEDRTD